MLVAFSIVFMFLSLIILRRALLNKAEELDSRAQTPSDYCLMGTNLVFDDDEYTPDKIEENLKKFFKDRYGVDVVYCNSAYKIDDFY